MPETEVLETPSALRFSQRETDADSVTRRVTPMPKPEDPRKGVPGRMTQHGRQQRGERACCK